MHFQLIKSPNKELESYFTRYFLRSKPYEFCANKSFFIRRFKIKEFFDFLFQTSEIYIGTVKGQIKFFCAIIEQESSAIIQFIFGTPSLAEDFREFRSFYKKVNYKIKKFETEINRENKKEKLIHFIKRKDPDAIFVLDNDKIRVLWNT